MTEFLQLPQWAQPVLQAITYWIGWNHIRYPHWHLTEGALVGELQRLIASKIDSAQQVLLAEVDVKDLCGQKSANEQTTRDGRVDLVLAKKVKGRSPKRSEVRTNATTLIEVKRSSSPWKEIEADIVRLSQLSRQLEETVRYFVLVTSEGKPLGKHVAKNGRARKGPQFVDDAEFQVRRLCRASATLKATSKSTHCACLVEIRGCRTAAPSASRSSPRLRSSAKLSKY